MSGMIDSERVSFHVSGGVADVRLVRPDKRNALDLAMLQAVIAAGERAAADPGVRAVVLSGDGQAFCAGLDTSIFAALAGDPDRWSSSLEASSIRNAAVQAVRVWVDLAVPVIAAVHGAAIGGGLQLALGADVRVAAPDAQLGLFEITWGIVPDMCGTQLLPRVVGPDVAKELMFTGRALSGTEAHALGLVTRLSDDPRATAVELAHAISSRNPEAIRAMKRLVDASWTLTLDDGVREEGVQSEAILGSRNQLEALVANLEQRPARFED
jgi:enoyl-CoA hydratase/carnithine racemase